MTDAAPAAAEGADTLSDLIAKGEAMKEAFFTGDDNREAIACIEWDAAVEAARPAPAAAPRAGDEDIREQTLREIEAIAESVEAASRRARDPHHEVTLHERALAIRAAAADVRAAAIEAARGEGHTNGL